MYKRNSPDKNKASMGCVRETHHFYFYFFKAKKEEKEASTRCVRETRQIKMKTARDV